MSPHTIRTAAGASCSAESSGAQVYSWKPAGDVERLYRSPLSHPGMDTVLRGGVPVIWPQFNAWGPYARHGFARRMNWTAVRETPDALRFNLQESAESLAEWPFAFQLALEAALSDHILRITLIVSNPGSQPFSFSAALHTYLMVQDLAQLRVKGLRQTRFQDWASGASRANQVAADDELAFAGEVDRIYFSAPRSVTLREPSRSLSIAQTGFQDMVIWNPGPEKAADLKDLPDDDWKKFVCLEAALIDPPISLPPGESWRGAQILHALPQG